MSANKGSSPDIGAGRQDSPRLVADGSVATETIDLSGLFQAARDITSTGSFDLKAVQATSLGKFLQAIPIPVLVIDGNRRITLANRSSARISSDYAGIEGAAVSSIFPDATAAAKAQTLIDETFSTRKSAVAEGVVRIGTSSMWVRMHLRALRVGEEQNVLLFLEQMPSEKKELRLKRMHEDEVRSLREELETQVRDRDDELSRILEEAELQASEIEQAKDSVKAAEATLANVFDVAPIGIAVLEQGRVIRANKSMLDTFGAPSAAEWIGKNASELFAHGDEYERIKEIMAANLAAGRVAETEARFVRCDGSFFEGRIRVRAVDSIGPGATCIAAVIDLSEKRRLEAELLDAWKKVGRPATAGSSGSAVLAAGQVAPMLPDSNQGISGDVFRAVFEHSPNAMTIIDADKGLILLANSAVRATLKHEVDDIIGAHYSVLKPGSEDLFEGRSLLRILDQGVVLEGCKVAAKDGSILSVDLTASPIAGKPGRAILLTFTNVTGRTNTETKLRESEARYRSLVEDSPVAIVSCDLQGKVVQLNAATANLFQASSIEAARQQNLLLYPPFVESGVSSAIGNALKTGQTVSGDFSKSEGWGKQTHFRLKVAPVRDESGTITGAQAVIEDVSDLKRGENALLQSARLKAVGQMAGGASRNLQGPLHTVGQSIQEGLGCLESRNYSGLRPLLEAAFDGNRKAARLAGHLLQFSRARPDRDEVHGEVFDVSAAAREALRITGLGEKTDPWRKGVKISLTTELADGCYIHGNEDELIEVIVNLLKNAQEALPLGGAIRIKTFVRGDQVVLQVQDDGVGISDKYVGTIFEPFWTTKDAHAGMGLSVNFGIVRQHRGSITVMSKKRRGATFTVRLPHVNVKAPMAAVEVAPIELPARGLRLLVMDDERAILNIMEKGLNRLGQTVYAASSGKEGLKIFAEKEVDAIVCDLAMPGMNGWEVSRAIRAACLERGIAKPPFILCTGWGGQLTEEEILAHPDVDRIVEKPIKVPALFDIVNKEVSGVAREAAFACRIDGIDILEYVQLVLLAGRQIVLEVLPRIGLRGLVFLDRGKVTHAVCGRLEGEDALYRCLNFQGGTFANLPWREPEKISIERPSEFLLIEAARRRDEQRLEE